MHTTYISSTIGFRSNASLSYSSHDYYHLLNNRFNTPQPSCTCCAFPCIGVPLNPSCSYGLRQSTLIHCPASTKLFFCGGGRFLRPSICDFNRYCCHLNQSCCDLNQSCQCSSNSSVRKKGKGRRFKCLIWEDSSESCDSGVGGNVDELLALLAEEDNLKHARVSKVREKNSRLSAARVQAEKKRANYVEPGIRGRNTKGAFTSVVESKKEDGRLSGRREGGLKGENSGIRKEASSCSSYYSMLSSDEVVDSDVDFQVESERFIGESSSKNIKEVRRNNEDVIVKNVIKQSKRNEDDKMEYREIPIQGSSGVISTAAVGSSDSQLRNQTEEVQSRIESSKNNQDSYEGTASVNFASQNRFRGTDNTSVSSTYTVDETRRRHNLQKELRETQRLTRNSQFQESDVGQAYSSQSLLSGREEKLNASVSLLEQRNRHTLTGQSIGHTESRRYSGKHSSSSESHEIDLRKASVSTKQSQSTSKKDESYKSSFHEAEEQKLQSGLQVTKETNVTNVSHELSNISVINDSHTAVSSDSQKIPGRRVSPQENVSTSYGSHISKINDSDIRRSSSSQIRLESMADASTSLINPVKAGEQSQTEETVVWETKSTKHPQDHTNISATNKTDTMAPGDLHENSEWLAEMSTSQEGSHDRDSTWKLFNMNKQTSEQQMDEKKTSGRNSQAIVMPPPSQRTSRGSIRYPRSASGDTTGDVCSPESGFGTLPAEETTPSSPDEFSGGIDMHNYDGMHVDALGSANRLEESSSQFVRQFVEKLNNEVSTSELPEEKMSSYSSLTNKNTECIEQPLNQQVYDEVHSQVHDLRKSSSRSGARGPSDAIWDVVAPSSEEPDRTEALTEMPSTSTGVLVRNSRSLWSIIRDIVRFRWAAHADGHNSNMKSGGKSSSNASAGSEAWFSSHEADERDDDKVKKGRRNMAKLRASSEQSPLEKAGLPSIGGASEGISSHNRVPQTNADALSSLDTVEGSSAVRGASSTSKEDIISWKQDDMSGQGSPSSGSMPSTLSSMPSRHLMRSPAVKGEKPESSKPVEFRSDFRKMDQFVQTSPNEGSGAEVKDGELKNRISEGSGAEVKKGELKNRKLQRKKQVEKETFEEWEDAFMLENEQRKIDEMFMREALLEAKKAAASWEVPVGAVLVQHGKVIARGCNLVEDLRDSTAHAELICIREASKELRTWRLSDTTLYVTLEPCAMCAGAILQARIDTVVWGAPNKLLGADGSWVRLFPGGAEAGSSSDLASQPAGPVHPFHPKITVRRGILATECADVMQQFFQLRRKNNKKSESPPTSSLPVSTHPSKFISKMHDIFHVMFCL